MYKLLQEDSQFGMIFLDIELMAQYMLLPICQIKRNWKTVAKWQLPRMKYSQ